MATTLNQLDALPAWARELSEKYYSGVTSMFVLHGNVRDLAPWRRPLWGGPAGPQPAPRPAPSPSVPGPQPVLVPASPQPAAAPSVSAPSEFLPLQRFLREALFGGRDLVLFYDRGGGLSFGHPDMKADFERALAGYDSFHGTTFAKGLPRNPDGVLNILDNYLRLRLVDNKKIAVVIDFAETIVPAGDSSGMPAEDRNSLVILKRWAQNPVFLQADVTFCLIAENLIELNLGLVQNPGVASIEIPLPVEAERLDYIRAQVSARPLPAGSDITPEVLANLTAGLKRVQLQA